MLKNEINKQNETEMNIDLTKMVASVGVYEEGISNELDGLSFGTLEFFRGTDEDGWYKGELIPTKLEDVGDVVSFEDGYKQVLDYALEYVFCEGDDESLEELKDLLNKLKEKAEGKNVKWILWNIEYDLSLGFIE